MYPAISRRYPQLIPIIFRFAHHYSLILHMYIYIYVHMYIYSYIILWTIYVKKIYMHICMCIFTYAPFLYIPCIVPLYPRYCSMIILISYSRLNTVEDDHSCLNGWYIHGYPQHVFSTRWTHEPVIDNPHGISSKYLHNIPMVISHSQNIYIYICI